jgi:hypothetical protein
MPAAQNRIRRVDATFAPPCGQSRSSTAIERPGLFSGDVGSIPIERAIFDGSQDWVIVHNDEVAGSNPASGTSLRSSSFGSASHNALARRSAKRVGGRSSSVVEHVIPSSFLIRRIGRAPALSAGRRLWVLVDPAVAVQVRPVAKAAVV